jgi:hypothetical protein
LDSNQEQYFPLLHYFPHLIFVHLSLRKCFISKYKKNVLHFKLIQQCYSPFFPKSLGQKRFKVQRCGNFIDVKESTWRLPLGPQNSSKAKCKSPMQFPDIQELDLSLPNTLFSTCSDGREVHSCKPSTKQNVKQGRLNGNGSSPPSTPFTPFT